MGGDHEALSRASGLPKYRWILLQTGMIFLRTIERLGDVEEGSGFPFELPPVRELRKVDLTSSVTFLAGENGTGKSTLLEAIGLRAKMKCAAGQPLEHDPALVPIHPLARSLKLTWMPPTKYGFFLRVEDFFVQAREQRQQQETVSSVRASLDFEIRIQTAERERTASESGTRTAAPPSGLSAGESFLRFLESHCAAGGIHLIDEPEAALSPQRQLAFMSLVKSVVDENAQFIIATHSPIILAYPGAQILSLDGGTISTVRYEDLPHVNFTREFLRNPETYLRQL